MIEQAGVTNAIYNRSGSIENDWYSNCDVKNKTVNGRYSIVNTWSSDEEYHADVKDEHGIKTYKKMKKEDTVLSSNYSADKPGKIVEYKIDVVEHNIFVPWNNNLSLEVYEISN